MLTVRTITTAEELDGLSTAWNILAAGSPFRSHDWQSIWWKHYGGDCKLAVLVVDEGRRVVAIAPLYIESSSARGVTLKLLGTGETCGDYLGILARPGREDEAAAALADYLVDEAPFAWDLVLLEGIDEAEPAVARLAEALSARGQTIDRRATHRCWRLRFPASWEGYMALQSKSHRKQLRRCERRVLEEPGSVLRRATDAESLAEGWQVLVDLHQRRRISLGEPGCFASTQFAAFHRELAERLLSRDALRLWWLEIDGRSIAAEYQFRGPGVTYAYQSGVDPNRLDEEPGRLITLATLKAAVEEGQTDFDFLRGDEPYKAHWRAESRQCHDWRFVADRTSAQLRHHAWRLADGVKGWLRGALAGRGE